MYLKATTISILSLACLILLFVITGRYTYADLLDDIPPLTVDEITDPRSSGKTFFIEGRVTSVFMPAHGIIVIKLYDQTKNMHIDSPVFPALGSLEKIPKPGDTVQIIGNLGFYKGQPQLRPLATEHVKVVATPTKADAIPLSQAILQIDKTLLVGPVSVISAKLFVAKKGGHHLRFTVAQGSLIVNGIMFAGVWSDADLDALEAGEKVLLNAKNSRYKNQPSLIVNRIVRQ